MNIEEGKSIQDGIPTPDNPVEIISQEFRPTVDIYDDNKLLAHYESDLEFIEDFKRLQQELNKYKSIVEELKEENRKLNNNIYDAIYLIKDLACYEEETHTYCDDINYYDVHKIIKELEEGKEND